MLIQGNVFANFRNYFRKGFSLIEVLVALIILTLIGLALVNTVVLFLQIRLINNLDNHMVDAARNLASVPAKVENCTALADPCSVFAPPDCPSSVSCNQTYCSADKCVACYVNPRNGKTFFYGFNATLISNATATGTTFDVYRVTLCRNYAGKTKTKTFVIHIRHRY